MQNEFTYIKDLIGAFIAQDNIRMRLCKIKDESISGFEIWLQIEFAYFLSNHDSEPEWHREIAINFDKRKEKEKSKLRVDFLIRKKGWRKDKFSVVEFKQHPNFKNLLANMINDTQKVSKYKKSDIELNEIWVFGIFRAENDSDLECIKNDIEFDDNSLISYKLIEGTGFAFILTSLEI